MIPSRMRLILAFLLLLAFPALGQIVQTPSVSEQVGTWTPIDSSGAGLTLTGVSAAYTVHGNIVFAYANLTYPSTANAGQATLGGLPFNSPAGNYGRQCSLQYSSTANATYLTLDAGAALIRVWTSAGVATTNANMSLQQVWLICTYPRT